MAFRNQNRPPRSPSTRKEPGDDNPLDKRRRLGAMGRGAGAIGTGRTRQPFSSVNNCPEVTAAVAAPEECPNHEFTKEEVEAILNEKPKAKKFDLKAKYEHAADHNKRLKLCVKWFQQCDEHHVLEADTLKNSLKSAVKRCTDIELEKKNKEEELNSIISKLRDNNTSLQEKLSKEVSEKLDAIERHKSENDARLASEKLVASLEEELERAQQDIATANERAASLDNTHKRSQEYILSLQQYNSKLINDLETVSESLKRVEKEKLTIVENLSTLRGHCSSLQEQLTSSRVSQDDAVKKKETILNEAKCLRGELQQVRDDRDRQMSQVQAQSVEIEKHKEITGSSLAELNNLKTKSKSLEDICSSQREQIKILELELAAANEKLKMTDLSASETRMEYLEKKRMVDELQDRLADMEYKLTDGENLRKKLHNTILELKGNIRVFCRVRPLLPNDGATTEGVIVSYPTSTESLGRGIDLKQSGQKYPFTFDKVFNHEASQQDVFVEISQLVQSALDGYKVCIFAYGQTGSGKTYTMMGRPEVLEQKGLIPRSLEQIFQSSQTLKAQGWKFKMQASMLEIYNETIRDLLSNNRSFSSDPTRPENAVSGKQYTIKHDANGNTYVSDLTIVDVSSITEVSSLLRQAAQSRSVGRTQMNEQSSRSHMVFTLRISGTNESTEQQVQGVLNLIDLAGSERLSRSGATGDRLKETQAINKSLSCLSDVIFALAKKDDHVPFRNSKLTYLLQPCLGGDSKTLMFVNVSPDPTSIGESLCSLRFAARVNACEIGVPRRQMTLQPTDSQLSCG
ncbi:Kinesin-1 [Hibiscus syriacus]|uniref:Kinesin-like protein n=1 Tax=Hibiscus syriacus TaxID=106335 RepID=A0A6A3CV86_HIBSY|nr:Kinesin-1 [Hibiscus syriacus]